MGAPADATDWAARYLGELATQRQLSAHTVEAYRRDLVELGQLAGHTDWPRLTHFDIRRFTAKLHAGGQSARSIARKLSGWRGFYAWLSRQTALAANPVEGVRAPKRPKTLPKALAVDAAVQLMEANVHGHPEPFELCNRAMFELLYSSGLRVSELSGLDLAYKEAGAQAGQPASLGWLDREAGEVVVTGKGGKMRRVPVGGPARAALDAWLAVRPAARDGSAQVLPAAFPDEEHPLFERVATVQATFNRLVIYRASILHSPAIPRDAHYSADPRNGRLTLTSFLFALDR